MSDVPLPNIAVIGAGQEVERVVFCDNALHCIVVAAEGPLVRVRASKSDGIAQVVYGWSCSIRPLSAARSIRRVTRVFDIEDANVVGAGHDRAVARVGHELHGEDVRSVACHDGGG